MRIIYAAIVAISFSLLGAGASLAQTIPSNEAALAACSGPDASGAGCSAAVKVYMDALAVAGLTPAQSNQAAAQLIVDLSSGPTPVPEAILSQAVAEVTANAPTNALDLVEALSNISAVSVTTDTAGNTVRNTALDAIVADAIREVAETAPAEEVAVIQTIASTVEAGENVPTADVTPASPN